MGKTDTEIPPDQMSVEELLNAIGGFKTTIPLDPVPPGDDPDENELWIRHRAVLTRAVFEQHPDHEAALACIHEYWMLMEMQPHLFLAVQDRIHDLSLEVTGNYRSYDFRIPKERESWKEARESISNRKREAIESVLAVHAHLSIANWAHDARIEELRSEILDFDASEGQTEQLVSIVAQLLSSVKHFSRYRDSIEAPQRSDLYPDYWQISWFLAEEALFEAVDVLAYVGVEEQTRFLSDAEPVLTDKKRVRDLETKLESVNQPFNLSFKDLASEELVDIRDYVGEVVLIDFWATWCKPCLDQVPHLKRILSRYQDRGFKIIGISCDTGQSAALVLQCAKTHGIDWPICIDKGFADQWRVKSIPTIFVVDKKGVLRATDISRSLKSSIEDLLNE